MRLLPVISLFVLLAGCLGPLELPTFPSDDDDSGVLDDDDSADDDDSSQPDDDDVVDDDDSAAVDPPVITGIEGWDTSATALGTAQTIAVEPGVVPDGVVVPDSATSTYAQHRFADAWQITGERLDLVTEVQLLDQQGTCPDAPFTGLTFEPGGTDMRVLPINIPGICAGAFTLALLSPVGIVEADVYVLQGEQGGQGQDGAEGPTGNDGADGADGFHCWDLNENDTCDAGEDVDGGGCGASDCQGLAGADGADGDDGAQGPQGDPGLDGDDGAQGPQGDPGLDGGDGADGLACWDLDESGSPDTSTEDINGDGMVDVYDCQPSPHCPIGYIWDNTETAFTLCYNPDSALGADEMVKVGDFWVDRYEASVWANDDCTGGPDADPTIPFGGGADDYPEPDFPDNGNWVTDTPPVYACSVPGVPPSRMLTWFQAQQSCAASGKDLCSNEQWQAAAAGTVDPGQNGGLPGGPCNTQDGAPRNTGMAASIPADSSSCVSAWGAEDMVGNLWEWAGDWYVAGQDWQTGAGQVSSPWPSGYEDDQTSNLDGQAQSGNWVNGLPAAVLRGGRWSSGTDAGVFALYLNYGPSAWGGDTGFRCCRSR
jgi:formylglycine-generating enzyme required for sulfatase activity